MRNEQTQTLYRTYLLILLALGLFVLFSTAITPFSKAYWTAFAAMLLPLILFGYQLWKQASIVMILDVAAAKKRLGANPLMFSLMSLMVTKLVGLVGFGMIVNVAAEYKLSFLLGISQFALFLLIGVVVHARFSMFCKEVLAVEKALAECKSS